MPRFDDETLVAYVDGELDAAIAREVEAAIREDAETRERVSLLRQSASLVGEVFRQPQYQQVSPALARRFGTQPEPARARRFSRFVLPVAASIAAALIGFGTGFWRGAARGDFADRLLDEVAEYHLVFAREGVHQVEVTGDRVDEIESWLGARLGRRLEVPDLSARGLTFGGARLLVVSHRPVAELVYTYSNQPDRPLALCIAAGPPEDIPLRGASEDDLNLVLWARKGFIYVLAGWVDQSLLAEISAELAPLLDDVTPPA